jgi:hypothetical protein
MVSANGALSDIDVEPRVVTSLTEMLEFFVEGRLNYHNRQYYAIWLGSQFEKGNDFLSVVHSMIDGKAVIPSHYYFDVVITGPVYWYDDNGIDALFPTDSGQLYYYRYYPNTGEYILYQVRNSFHISNYGNELMFTNIDNFHGTYELGEYTLLNPQGNPDYWGSNVEIYHDIKLYDKGQIEFLLSEKYYDGYIKGKEDGKNLIIDESEAYQKGYNKGINKGYDEGFRDGRITTDKTTRNILAFGGNVLGSIFSFILYVSTEIELFGVRLIDVMVALAVIAIIIFIIKLIGMKL